MTEVPSDKGSLRTRASLLFRLRDWRDDVSWAEFYRLYFKLVYGLARRTGLPHAEAEEVAQDVFKRVSETIDQFESDPNRGSFRGWLMNLTRWRVMDRYRAQKREATHLTVNERDDPSTEEIKKTIEDLPDTSNLNEDAVEAEWRESLMATALERLGGRTLAKHFQVFDLYTRQKWPVLKVARALSVNPATVYVISHRLTKELRAEIERLKSQLG